MASFSLLTLYQDLNRQASTKGKENQDIRFDIKASFGGYADSISPNLLPAYIAESSINNVGFGTYLEKMIGSSVVGVHIDVDVKELIGIKVGSYYTPSGNLIIFKLVSYQNGVRFYILRDLDNDGELNNNELTWLDITPTQGLPNTRNYNYAIWRNELYLVCGERFTLGSSTGGVMVYNPNQGTSWRVIDTGFGVANNGKSNGADGANPFYPSLINFFNDTMYLAGSKEYSIQVKFSEHSNPDNVIGSQGTPFLGLLDTVPVVSDVLRPSTFVLNQNGDKITALFNANGYLWIATNRRFYAFKTLTSLDTRLPAGLLWLDTLQEHKSRVGTFSQKTILQTDSQIQFLAKDSSEPGLATMVPIISQDSIDKVYGVKSDYIQNTFKDLDLSEACMGIYGIGSLSSMTFISGAKCAGGSNNTTLVMKQLEGTPLFTKAPYIHAIDWHATNNDTFWLSSETGELFRLDTKSFQIQGTDTNSSYPFVYQTGRIGVATNDQDFSQKQVKYIWIVGCSSEDIELKFKIFRQTEFDGQIYNGLEEYSYIPTLDKTDLQDYNCSDDAPIPFIHRKGVLWSRLLAVEKYNIKYNVLNIRLEAITTGYFALHQIGVIYERLEAIDSQILAEIELI